MPRGMWKTSPEIKVRIVEMCKAGEKYAAIAERFGISVPRVCQIAREAGLRRQEQMHRKDAPSG